MGEKILKEKKGVHMAMKDFSSSSSKKENKNKKNNTKQGKFKRSNRKSKLESKCFLYGKKGHQKKECPVYLKKKKEDTHLVLIVESFNNGF